MFFMNITTPVFSPKTMPFTHVLGFIDKELQEFWWFLLFYYLYYFFLSLVVDLHTCLFCVYLLLLIVLDIILGLEHNAKFCSTRSGCPPLRN